MRYLTRSLCAFPVLLLASFYATWVAGRLALGYWPRPSLDDPKSIEGGLMWLSYLVTMVLVTVGVPLFCLAVIALALVCMFRKPEGWSYRLLELLAALVLFVGFVLFARWDPHSVVAWYFD